MDRVLELLHLKEAEQRIRRGERQISDQEQRILDLDDRGHDSVLARSILESFRASQSLQVGHRDLILAVLSR